MIQIGYPGEDIIKNAGSILLTSHMHPDGDAIGSMIGLGLALREMGKETVILAAQPLPSLYEFLPGSNLVVTPREVPAEKRFDCGVILDCTSLDRLNNETVTVFDRCQSLINIDHHISNSYFGAVNIVEPEASSTGELIFRILSALGIRISPAAATNLYTALVADTGSFQYQNATFQCHQVASSLLKLGADQNRVQRSLNEQKTLASIRLLEKGLATLAFDPESHLAWMTIPRHLFVETECRIEDSEDFINYPKSIAGVEIGILFKEIAENEIRVGFRSKSVADVNLLAGQFGGGGHERAAGCTVKGPLTEVEALVIKAARDYLHKELYGEAT